MWQILAGALLGAVAVIAAARLRRHRDVSTEPELVVSGAEVEQSEVVSPLEEALNALPVGVVVRGADGREVFRNYRAESFTGLPHADVLVEEAAERLWRLALSGVEADEQVLLAGPPQRVFFVRADPLAHGGAVATVEDITERWRLDQVRTDFVANVSHELKTPVGAVSILAETLEGESTDDVVRRLAGRMIGETQRMSRTIDDLLELSRIEMGGAMEVGPVDLADVVREAVERSRSVVDQFGVKVILDLTDGEVIDGDYYQLVSAVGNLVENAVKYGQAGETVEVTVRSAGDSIEVEIVDHGVGIPPGSIDRIFERFYRVDRARSRETGGTGLGLAIVRHVATNHGGEVNVRSREGEGSTFILRIPKRASFARTTSVTSEVPESRRD